MRHDANLVRRPRLLRRAPARGANERSTNHGVWYTAKEGARSCVRGARAAQAARRNTTLGNELHAPLFGTHALLVKKALVLRDLLLSDIPRLYVRSMLRRLRRGAVCLLRVRIRPAAGVATAAAAARHTVVNATLRLVAEDTVRFVHQLEGLGSTCNSSLRIWMQRFRCALAYSGGDGALWEGVSSSAAAAVGGQALARGVATAIECARAPLVRNAVLISSSDASGRTPSTS